jgi:hypothetical protein
MALMGAKRPTSGLQVIFIVCALIVIALIFKNSGDWDPEVNEVLTIRTDNLPEVVQGTVHETVPTIQAAPEVVPDEKLKVANISKDVPLPLPPAVQPSRLWDPLAWVAEQGEDNSMSDKCSSSFGMGYLTSWQGTRQDLCKGDAQSVLSSSVVSYPVAMPTDFWVEMGRAKKNNMATEAFNVVLASSEEYHDVKKGSFKVSSKGES